MRFGLGSGRAFWPSGWRVAVLLGLLLANWGCSNREQGTQETNEAAPSRKRSELSTAFTNSVGIRMIPIRPGSFVMGGNTEDVPLIPRLRPLQRRETVTISNGYFLGATEVTNAQFERFVSDTGYGGGDQGDKDFLRHTRDERFAGNRGAGKPVVFVSWHDARAFCEWLSQAEGRSYRLPTEAEWEYACKAGTDTRYGGTSDPEEVLEYAWLKGNAGGRSHKVAQKQPNPWGLYDMVGNVCEWTSNIMPAHLGKGTPYEGMRGAWFRGGYYQNAAEGVYCWARWTGFPVTERSAYVGFRIICDD